jgi:glycosyltransferase involved in cell wall biosynthesis
MPAYQLSASIEANIERVVDALDDLDVEIVVVDDGSTDGTLACADRAAARHPNVQTIGYPANRGKGGALQAGFAVSTGDPVVFLDGDLDLPPEQVPALVGHFTALGADVIVGAKQRAMEPGRYPPLRRLLSKVFSTVIKLLFRLPVHETQTGLKVFRREPLDRFLPTLTVKRYTFDLELLVRLHRAGYTIREAPVELAEGASSSGVSLGTLWEMGRDTLRIWFDTVLRRT